MKATAIVLSLLVSFTLAVPVAHADDQQVTVTIDLSYPSHEYVSFVDAFSVALIEGLEKGAGQNPAPDHWLVSLLPVVSPTGKAMVEIKAIRNAGESERPILIAVLNEDSPRAVIRTAVKSTQRVLSTGTRQQRQQGF